MGIVKPTSLLNCTLHFKEANETKYWLVLLNKSNYISNDEFNRLENECEKIKAMLIKSLNQ